MLVAAIRMRVHVLVFVMGMLLQTVVVGVQVLGRQDAVFVRMTVPTLMDVAVLMDMTMLMHLRVIMVLFTTVVVFMTLFVVLAAGIAGSGRLDRATGRLPENHGANERHGGQHQGAGDDCPVELRGQ